MRKWIPAFLILAGFAFGGLVFERLPERVSPHWGVLLPWTESALPDAMPRAVAAFGLPGLALLVWLLLKGVASPAGERLGRRIFPAWFVSPQTGARAVERFGPTFDLIVAAVVTFILLFHAVTLGTVLSWPAWTAQVFAALIGVGMAVVGNTMPRTRPNWVAGLRTRRTLADPDHWRRTHRWFGGLLMAFGVAVVVAAVVSAPAALVTALVGALASAVVATVVAGRGSTSGSSDRTAVILWIALLGFPGAAHAAGQAQHATSDSGSTFIELALDVTSDGVVLPGTLTLPTAASGPVPAAVIVVGSGPTDRNGNGPDPD